MDMDKGLVLIVLTALLSCNAPPKQPPILGKNVSFYSVPMVCNAAPSIGCGSRAKFVMLDLMKDQVVKEAWLNRKGTVMAAVWREGSTESDRQKVVNTVFTAHGLEVDPMSDSDVATHAQGFETKDNWYEGADVDKLSIEEAGVIADRLVTALTMHAKFKNENDKKAFREDVRGIMERCFLGVNSFEELNGEDHQKEIYRTAVKYIGKKSMPSPDVLREEYSRLQEQECENTEGRGACCPKDTAAGKNG